MLFRASFKRSRSQPSVIPEICCKIICFTLDLSSLARAQAKHWKPPDPGMFNVDASNYALSRQADWFDDFLSHDWRTSRFSKLCTLLVVYNSRAALLAAFLACPLIALGRTVGVLPNDRPSSCLVYVVHLFVLCFWQRLRSILRPPIMVFLDTLSYIVG